MDAKLFVRRCPATTLQRFFVGTTCLWVKQRLAEEFHAITRDFKSPSIHLTYHFISTE